ncbi:hypothetical protein GF324_11380 [bacterium]|nr:hypothetical protein [bacterium]
MWKGSTAGKHLIFAPSFQVTEKQLGLRWILFVFLIVLLPLRLPAQTLTAPDGTTVTIQRDEYGVPHVIAQSETGVFFGQGFAIAADRLYQMDTYRRAGEGRLSEILGPGYLPLDQEARLYGYSDEERTEQFNVLSPEHQFMLSAYADGVNAYIDSCESNPSVYLPTQFQSYPLEEWSAHKTLAVVQFMAMRFGVFGGEELTRAVELEANGEDWFNENRPLNDPDAPTTIHEQTLHARPDMRPYHGVTVSDSAARALEQFHHEADLAALNAGLPPKFGSFAVLASTQKSESNGTMLFGAPQMGPPQQHATNTVAEVELDCPQFHVGGACIAGVPGVIIGRTESFAWTLTSGISDNSDIFILETEDATLSRYQFNGEWVEFDTLQHTIAVSGSSDRDFTVTRSLHGPVVASDPDDLQAYAEARTCWESESDLVTALYDVWHASSLEEVNEAVEDNTLSFNLFYADISGNLKYHHIGRYVDRSDAVDPRLPRLGDGTEEWSGFLPFDELPHADHTDQDYFVNWNNKPAVWWDNGDNVPWVGSNHPVNNIDVYIAPRSPLSFNDLADVPEAINDVGSWMQAVDFGTADQALNILPPGQSGFVDIQGNPSPHKTDQWPLHQDRSYKPWVFDAEYTAPHQPVDASPLDQGFMLHPAFPNPFNEIASVSVTLPFETEMTLSLYDLLGREVERIAEGLFTEGRYMFTFYGGDLPSGVYLVRARFGLYGILGQKIVLMK